MNIRDLFPSKWAISALVASVLLSITSVVLAYNYGVSRHDLGQTNLRLTATETERDEFREKYVGCETSLGQKTAQLTNQTNAVNALRTASEQAARDAQAALERERARTRQAEARRQELMRATVQPNETVCEAAFRLHRENVQ